MRRIFIIARWAAFLALPVFLPAQETLTNETVLRVWRAGMPDSFILGEIRSQPGNYSLTGADLQKLRDVRLPEMYIDAMFAKGTQQNQAPRSGSFTQAAYTAPAPAPASASSSVTASYTSAPRPAVSLQESSGPVPTGTALFYRKGTNWIEVDPETMSWQGRSKARQITGSVAKYPTMGIMGRAVKATVPGEFSRNLVPDQTDLVVDIPSNASMHDFVLVPMHVGRGIRTIEVGTNRNHAAHQSLHFGLEKTQVPNQYKVIFADGMAPGEYGVYNVSTVFSHDQQTAKVYTFSLQ